VTGVQVSAHVLLAWSRIASVRATSVLYYHRDQRGSVIATTVTGGVVGAKYRYGPYGQLDKVEGETTANASELGFTGGLRLGWNPSTGVQTGSLLLLGARVYDAAMKRWLQADTVDEKRYMYADGDPVNMVDPSGRLPFEPYRPPEGSVCFGSTCVPGDMAGFYAERMLGICSDPAECQLMLGLRAHEARLANTIERYFDKVDSLRRASADAGVPPTPERTDTGCSVVDGVPICSPEEITVTGKKPAGLSNRQAALLFAGNGWRQRQERSWVYGWGFGAGLVLNGGVEVVVFSLADSLGQRAIMLAPAARLGVAIGIDAGAYFFVLPGKTIDDLASAISGSASLGVGAATVSVPIAISDGKASLGLGVSGGRLGAGFTYGIYATGGASWIAKTWTPGMSEERLEGFP
jgi:RHS repeat-associated protein